MRKIELKLENAELTERERAVAERILVTQGANKGCVRASKPKVSKDDADSGIAAYVWRMLVFTLSNERAHQCMPVCADFDLPGRYRSEEYLEAKDFAEPLIKKLGDLVSPLEHVGAIRWGVALGLLNTY